MATKPTDDVESPAEDTGEDEATETAEGVKVPESFQQECVALVNGVKTLPQLNFLSDLVNEQRTALQKSQKKSGLATDNFSTEGMPMS
jgi:hypothetical protein